MKVSTNFNEDQPALGPLLVEARDYNFAINWVAVFLSFGLRLVPMLPLSKMPYRASQPDLKTGWNVVFIDSPDSWRNFMSGHQHANIAIIWTGCQVDCDSPEAIEWAKDNGISNSSAAWILRTGRGWRLFFRAPDTTLKTLNDPNHKFPDLISPGRLAVIPPSIHPSGIPYRWLPGHSPIDIPLDRLSIPTQSIVDAWQQLSVPKFPKRYQREYANDWLNLVFNSICRHLEGKGHCLHPTSKGGFTTTCPFHDDRNPSLSIHPERGWICFAGCGSGSLKSLAQRLGLNYRPSSNSRPMSITDWEVRG